MHGSERQASSAAGLAHRPAMRLGGVTIDPATRRIEGPDGATVVRPQVMLVLLTLHDAAGGVVTRDELVERAWGGRFVAEDSLNGAISEIRRALRTAGAHEVEVVTVPKTGYRLQHPGFPAVSPFLAPSRRALLGWGAAGGLALAGGAVWQWRDRGTSGRADQLLDEGLIALRQGLPESDAQGVRAFRTATALDPDNARAWGLLALALKNAADYAPPHLVGGIRVEAEGAARRALALDPAQSDAKTALALLTPMFGRWLETERRLRAILAADPANLFASSGLSMLLMSTGQVRECLKMLDRQVARDPLSPNLQFRRVYTLWSAGRLAEADATADRALQSWPRHPAVWFARFYTFAFTGRAGRARAMLEDSALRPPMPAPVHKLLGLSLAALDRPGSPIVSQAIAAHVAAAARGPAQAVGAIMVLSSLGAGDRALDVARGFLTQQGAVVVAQRHSERQPSITDLHHRMTMMLWIPATANLRREPGFPALCEEIGLGDYWRRAGVRPDLPIGPA